MTTQYTVCELPGFRATADDLTVDERMAIATHLSANPLDGDLIPSGGGARKLRWATVPGKGKSGGARIIHFFANAKGTVYLIAIYEKSKKANLTQAQVHAIAKLCKHLGGNP